MFLQPFNQIVVLMSSEQATIKLKLPCFYSRSIRSLYWCQPEQTIEFYFYFQFISFSLYLLSIYFYFQFISTFSLFLLSIYFYFQFWNIVPLEHLLVRLEIDDPPVCRRIMKLLFSNFMPIKHPIEIQMGRCVSLIQTNSGAAREFFSRAHNYMSIQDAGENCYSLCHNFFRLLARKPNLDKNCQINSFIIFTCPNPVLLVPCFKQVG
jgi:hypothetical protein